MKLLNNQALIIAVISVCLIVISCSSTKTTPVEKRSERQLRKDFSEYHSWYSHFLKDDQTVKIEFLPDSLELVDSMSPYLSEKDLIEYFRNKNMDISNFIADVHRKDRLDYNNLYKDDDFYKARHYFYYTFSLSKWTSNSNKYNINKYDLEIQQKVNTVQISPDSLLFSSRYKNFENETLPKGLIKLINEIVDEAKADLKYRNPSYYNIIRNYKVDYNPRYSSPLWFAISLNHSAIYISPAIIRAIYMMSIRDDYSNFLFNQYNLDKNHSLFSSSDRKTRFDYYVNVKAFRDFFATQLSLILHHEMAHAYLGSAEISEQNESKCDCYALAHYTGNKILIIGGGKKQGIYQNLLKESIRANKPEFWALKDTMALVRRFNIMDRLFREDNISTIYCDTSAIIRNAP